MALFMNRAIRVRLATSINDLSQSSSYTECLVCKYIRTICGFVECHLQYMRFSDSLAPVFMFLSEYMSVCIIEHSNLPFKYNEAIDTV